MHLNTCYEHNCDIAMKIYICLKIERNCDIARKFFAYLYYCDEDFFSESVEGEFVIHSLPLEIIKVNSYDAHKYVACGSLGVGVTLSQIRSILEILVNTIVKIC